MQNNHSTHDVGGEIINEAGRHRRPAMPMSGVWHCSECDAVTAGPCADCKECQPWGNDPKRPRKSRIRYDERSERAQNRQWTKTKDAGALWLRSVGRSVFP